MKQCSLYWYQEMPEDLDDVCTSGADEAFHQLDLVDLNVILHRADGEERDATGESAEISDLPLLMDIRR
jgi:glycogen debranching enzyme